MRRYKVTFTTIDASIMPVPKSEMYFNTVTVAKSHLGIWTATAIVEAPSKGEARTIARRELMTIAPTVMTHLLSHEGVAAP